MDDIDDRINEKALAVSSDDCGKDLTGVQALRRKQDEVERDMTALQAQLEATTSYSSFVAALFSFITIEMPRYFA